MRWSPLTAAYLLFAGIVVVLIVITLAIPVSAHDAEAQAEWYAEWSEKAALGITPELIAEMVDFQRRHEPPSVTVTKPTPSPSAGNPGTFTGMGQDVAQWTPLVEAYFPADEVTTALCVMRWESGGNPNAVNASSGAAGLFQIMPFWWDHYGGNRYDPDTNVRTARLIWDQQGWAGWSAYNRGRC
jgi:hypothetical protein